MVPVEAETERNGIVRLLLANDDEANTFALQCAINRLSKPCAFQRMGRRELLSEKIESFRPDLLVAAGSFTKREGLKQIKELTSETPIICLVETTEEGEASLMAGATDCVLLSQQYDLGECLEAHLTGTFSTPYFRYGRKVNSERKVSAMEQRLEEFDRKVGASLRRMWIQGRRTGRKWQVKISETVRRGQKWALQQYRAWQVKRRERSSYRERVADADLLEVMEPVRVSYGTEATSNERLTSSRNQSWELDRGGMLGVSKGGATPESEESSESSSDALRAMELSFKSLFHAALDAMFLLDGTGSFLHVNPAGCALLGKTPAQILGRSLFEFVPVAERSQISGLWEAMLVEGQQKTECTLHLEGGVQKEVLLSARANLWFGVHLMVARDLTELKALRALQAQQAALLQAAQSELPTRLQPGPSALG